MTSHTHIPIAGLPNVIDQLNIEDVSYDYTEHSENIRRVAQMYRELESANVRIYNKIKHVFPLIERNYWLDRPLDSQYVGIAIDDKGTIALLSMVSEEVEKETMAIRQIIITGTELMALYFSLYRLGVLASASN